MQMIVQVGKHQVSLKSLDDWAYYFYLAHRCQVARDADGTSVLHLLSSFAHGFSRWQEGVGRRLEFLCNYQKVDKMMKQVGKNTQLIEAFKAFEEEQGAGAVLTPVFLFLARKLDNYKGVMKVDIEEKTCTWNLRGLDGSEEGEGGELSQQPEDMDGVVEEFEDVVLDQEGPGVGIHMFIFIVNTIDISALLTHRGQAPVPPSFSLFNRESAGTSRRGAPGRNQLLLPLASGL